MRPRGRFLANVPSPIPPLFTILAERLERHGHHGAAEFVRQVFSLGDVQLEELLNRAGFADVSVTATHKILRLPAPDDFLWQYVTSTPLGAVFADLEDTERRDFALAVVEEWGLVREEAGIACSRPARGTRRRQSLRSEAHTGLDE